MLLKGLGTKQQETAVALERGHFFFDKAVHPWIGVHRAQAG